MEAFLVSITTISVAEIGDRTQLLSLLLAARYRRPWPIIAGIFCATLANHAVAGALGVWFGSLLKPRTLEVVVGISMIAMAIWTLKPDKLDENTGAGGAMGAFLATLTSFFIAEIGDKTQIATLGARSSVSESAGRRCRNHCRHDDRQRARGVYGQGVCRSTASEGDSLRRRDSYLRLGVRLFGACALDFPISRREGIRSVVPVAWPQPQRRTTQAFAVHGQFTYVEQDTSGFNAPYRGPK